MLRTIASVCLCVTLVGCTANTPVLSAMNSAILDPIKVSEQQKPPYLVTGRVHVEGVPVQGILVEAYTVDCFSGPLIAKAVTDAKGEFSFKDMKPDTYFIGLNEFRGSGKLLPSYTSTCSKGRAFSGARNLDFQLPVAKR